MFQSSCVPTILSLLQAGVNTSTQSFDMSAECADAVAQSDNLSNTPATKHITTNTRGVLAGACRNYKQVAYLPSRHHLLSQIGLEHVLLSSGTVHNGRS